MAKIMDPVLPILSILGYKAIILGSSGGLGNSQSPAMRLTKSFCACGVEARRATAVRVEFSAS